MDDDTVAFTQGILARARERQKMIDQMKKKENIVDEPKKETSSKRVIEKTCSVEEEMSFETENVRVEVEIQDEESDKENDGNDDANAELSGLREQAKYKLRKLGKLYSADGDTADISSPIQNSEAYFNVQNETSEVRRPACNSKSKKGLSKLADLAQNIRQWDDDTSPTKTEKNIPDKIMASPARKSISKSTVTSYNKVPASPVKKVEEKTGTKNVVWDAGVIKALESQGFTRTESNSRLVYDCKSPKKPTKAPQTPEKRFPETKPQDKPVPEPIVNQKRSMEEIIPLGIQAKKALFESSSPIKYNKKANDSISKDPSLLSLADRKALFEKNKGAALVPKAAFGMAVPVGKDGKAEVKEKENLLTKFARAVEENRLGDKKFEVKGVGSKGGVAGRIETLQENKEEKLGNGTMTTQQEIEMLRNRFNKNKNINDVATSNDKPYKDLSEESKKPTVKNVILKSEMSTPEQSKEEVRRISERRRSRRKSDSPQVTSVLDGLKHIKVLKPKDGYLYPPLSDIETNTETEAEPMPSSSEEHSFNDSYNSEDANTSFGREILQVVCKNQTTTPMKRSICDDSSDSNVSGILDDMDDYLDEAMAHADRSDYSNGPTPPKKANNLNDSGLKQCNSFHYKSFTSESKFASPTKIITSPNCVRSPRRSSELPSFVVDGENVMPLKHTVSVYRKQQSQANTPVRKILHNPTITEDEDDIETDEATVYLVEQKIKTLTEEVNKQQMIISQTSRALSLCNSTLEFTGSTEQVEAEKLLLLASHRRQAALHEVQRLKVQGTLRPQDQHARHLPLEKGTLTISNIKLPLKREYVRALAAAGGKGHHVICLVKSGEQVVASQLVSTVASSNANADNDLVIRDEVKLENIFSDFAVTFEVYCLQAQEEILPHDVKYHINKKASNKLTPKKAKHESRLVIPPKESPAGPHAVRTSSFAMMGYVVFSIQTVNKTHFSLNNAPSMSPLEGHVYMKISCNLAVSCEHKGFLTMFEDVSGFGAWHRRWCVLRGDTMSYWKYPDHEKEKAPVGSLSLTNCVTENVGLVSRSICARLNTIMLEMERESVPGEKTSLTLQHKDDKTILRYLLSSDTKEERVKWCEMFNKALIAIRMWGRK